MFRPAGAHVPSGGKRWAASGCSSARMGHGVLRCHSHTVRATSNAGSTQQWEPQPWGRGRRRCRCRGGGPCEGFEQQSLSLHTTYYLLPTSCARHQFLLWKFCTAAPIALRALVAHVSKFCCGNLAQQSPSPSAPSSPTSPNCAVEILHSSPRPRHSHSQASWVAIVGWLAHGRVLFHGAAGGPVCCFDFRRPKDAEGHGHADDALSMA